jgi:hypothetical protein
MTAYARDKYLMTSYIALLFGALVFLAGFLPALFYGSREGALTVALILAVLFVTALAIGGIGYTRRPHEVNAHENRWLESDRPLSEAPNMTHRAAPLYHEENTYVPESLSKPDERAHVERELRERKAAEAQRQGGRAE